SKHRVPMRNASAGIASNVTFSTKAAASAVTFMPEGSGAKGFCSAIGNQLFGIVLKESVDDFRDVVIHKATMDIRAGFDPGHRVAFFFGMELYRSERGRQDLEFGTSHQVETETAELV